MGLRGTQALASHGLSVILQTLKEQFDYVVVDSAPVLPVVDSLLIGQSVDGVLFSILHQVSQMPAVQSAYQRLASIGVRMLGAVVNGEPMTPHSYGYTYTPAAVRQVELITPPAPEAAPGTSAESAAGPAE